MKGRQNQIKIAPQHLNTNGAHISPRSPKLVDAAPMHLWSQILMDHIVWIYLLYCVIRHTEAREKE